MSNAANTLVRLLRDPSAAEQIGDEDWASAITAARAELLLGSLATRLAAVPLSPKVKRIMEDARADATRSQVQALWEAEMARRALCPLALDVVLLKGSAYAAAGLDAAEGRSIGDLDILVPRERLEDVQRALLGAGWEWVKEDAYDDLYYRRWMHELPPLIHRERDRMIDVHHTILPLTARPRPDASAMIVESIPIGSGLRVLSPPDMIVHSAAHLFADGDLAGGLRNLWDIDRLLRQFASQADFWPNLASRARLHELAGAVRRSVRLAHRIYGTPIGDPGWSGPLLPPDRLFAHRLLARDGWGRAVRPALRLGFYARSHLLRMPPLMLARHLLIKARRRPAGP